ncbi:MAG: hypothetical protein ACRBBW_13885 [Cellvibrionaceae bacterium]
MLLHNARFNPVIRQYSLRFITWSHWLCTSAAWQDFFRGEDDDPRPFLGLG